MKELDNQEKCVKKNTYAALGVIVGGLALILALVHFWAGPFTPQPSLESFVSETALSIRQAAIGAWQGKSVAQVTSSAAYNADKITQIIIAVLGGIAFILAALSLANHETKRAAASAAVLGAAAIAFQFIAMYVMALLVILLIYAVLSGLGVG